MPSIYSGRIKLKTFANDIFVNDATFKNSSRNNTWLKLTTKNWLLKYSHWTIPSKWFVWLMYSNWYVWMCILNNLRSTIFRFFFDFSVRSSLFFFLRRLYYQNLFKDHNLHVPLLCCELPKILFLNKMNQSCLYHMYILHWKVQGKKSFVPKNRFQF